MKSPDSFVNETTMEMAALEKAIAGRDPEPTEAAAEENKVSSAPLAPAELRKSVPRPSLQPYNDNFMQTYESSEFDCLSPEKLPGMIFGLGGKQEDKAPFLLQQIGKTSLLLGESPHGSEEQTLGNLQVNLDQTLTKTYALNLAPAVQESASSVESNPNVTR